MTFVSRCAIAVPGLALALALAACGDRTDDLQPRAQATAPSSATGGASPSSSPPAVGLTADATKAMGAGPQALAPSTPMQMGSVPVSPTRMDDGQIVSTLRAQYAMDNDISAMVVDVDAKDGIVTLSGTVASADARIRADQMARAMKDVKSVNNQIGVKAS